MSSKTQRERFEAWRLTVPPFHREEIPGLWLAWQAAEVAALEQAWDSVHAERLVDPTDSADDIAYQRAIEDAEDAIRALAAPVERDGDKS